MCEFLSKFLLACVLCAAPLMGCAGDDEPIEPESEEIREAHDPDPFPDGGFSDDEDDQQPDDTCPSDACTPGETRCEQEAIQTCEQDPARPSCGVWGAAEPCEDAAQVCVEGACQSSSDCEDADGDGYGVQCAAGLDCDDSDPNVHADAPELCDNVDNDCDGDIDEDFELGAPCTMGSGECAGEGFTTCGEAGDVVCQATAGSSGSPETCDGLDNDCDGVIDNGDVCEFCGGDPNEPNDAATQASALAVNDTYTTFLCPADKDFFAFPAQAGQTYYVFVTFPEVLGDVRAHLHQNGARTQTSDTTGTDFESFVVQASANGDLPIEIENMGGAETFYRVSVVDQIACPDEDPFVPNQDVSQAAYLAPSWPISGHVCAGTDDWYYMGQLDYNDEVYIELSGSSGDLDLVVYGDPDGDGTFNEQIRSEEAGSNESINGIVNQPGPFAIRVLEYGGGAASYDLHWTRN